jgi:hypothetical protein
MGKYKSDCGNKGIGARRRHDVCAEKEIRKRIILCAENERNGVI